MVGNGRPLDSLEQQLLRARLPRLFTTSSAGSHLQEAATTKLLHAPLSWRHVSLEEVLPMVDRWDCDFLLSLLNTGRGYLFVIYMVCISDALCFTSALLIISPTIVIALYGTGPRRLIRLTWATWKAKFVLKEEEEPAQGQTIMWRWPTRHHQDTRIGWELFNTCFLSLTHTMDLMLNCLYWTCTAHHLRMLIVSKQGHVPRATHHTQCCWDQSRENWSSLTHQQIGSLWIPLAVLHLSLLASAHLFDPSLLVTQYMMVVNVIYMDMELLLVMARDWSNSGRLTVGKVECEWLW